MFPSFFFVGDYDGKESVRGQGIENYSLQSEYVFFSLVEPLHLIPSQQRKIVLRLNVSTHSRHWARKVRILLSKKNIN